MRKVTPIILLIVLLVSSLGLAACGSDDAEGENPSVKIAVSVPLGLSIGQDVVNALQLALDERDGEVNGVDVSLLVLDTSDPAGSPVSVDFEQTVAQEAVNDDDVIAYIGPMTTDQAKASIPILNEASIAQITESATWPGLTRPGFGPGEPGIYYPTGRRTFFRVLPADDVQAVGGALWIKELGYDEVLLVTDGTGYGNGLGGIFEVSAEDIDLDVMDTIELNPRAQSVAAFTSVVEKVLDADPPMIYFGGAVAPVGVYFVEALREAAPDIPVMGPDGLFQQELIDDVGAAQVEGIYVTNPIIPADELDSAAAFSEAYTAAYDSEPLPYVLTAYAAIESVFAAIENADEITREGIAEALAELDQVEGVFGTWAFDSYGDTTFSALSGWRVIDGEWTFIETLDTTY